MKKPEQRSTVTFGKFWKFAGKRSGNGKQTILFAKTEKIDILLTK